MIIGYLSASRIKTYIQCTMKYHYQYEEKIKSDAEHLRFGTCMHSVFERYFQEPKPIQEIFKEEWQKAPLASLEYYNDAFPILDLFEKNNDRDSITPIGFEIPFAINLLTDEAYDVSEVNFDNYEEVKVLLNKLEAEDAPIIYGFIDRVDYLADKDTIKIVDYKTSRIALSQQEADDDIQLSMYALVAQYLFPQYERVQLELQYVREGTPVRTVREDGELSTFKDYLISIYYKIKSDENPKASINHYCSYCEGKHKCPAYQELMEKGFYKEFKLEDMTDERLDEELEKLKDIEKIVESRKKEITKYFQDKLKVNEGNLALENGAQRYLTNNPRLSYDPYTVISLFPDKLGDLLSVSKQAVDDLVKESPEVQELLKSTGKVYYNSPTLRRKKSKK